MQSKRFNLQYEAPSEEELAQFIEGNLSKQRSEQIAEILVSDIELRAQYMHIVESQNVIFRLKGWLVAFKNSLASLASPKRGPFVAATCSFAFAAILVFNGGNWFGDDDLNLLATQQQLKIEQYSQLGDYRFNLAVKQGIKDAFGSLTLVEKNRFKPLLSSAFDLKDVNESMREKLLVNKGYSVGKGLLKLFNFCGIAPNKNLGTLNSEWATIEQKLSGRDETHILKTRQSSKHICSAVKSLLRIYAR